LQEEIITSILSKKDTLAILPTGGGKSICYQIPALASEGVCIVVSPLIALMKDQVDSLQEKEIEAHAIFSGMHYSEIDKILDNAAYGNVKLLYLSPERLHSKLFVERFKKMKVSFIAVDEAHCISQWGYDFRPAYLSIAKLKEIKPNVPTIALTASATKKVQLDIAEKLEFEDYQKFINSFARNNISYNTRYEEDKFKRLLLIFEKVNGSAIVYVRSRNKTEEIAKFLIENNYAADYYHAGLSTIDRSHKQNLWIKNKLRVIVATNAFGMGIDKADVRLVVHFDIPDSLEAYYQEAGRAGRDGNKSYAITIFNNSDVKKLKQHLSVSNISIDKTKEVYQAVGNYFNLAEGSGKGRTFDFYLNDFCKIFKFNLRQAKYCLKLLNDESYLSVNEAFLISSRLKFIVNKSALYRFEDQNKHASNFIKSLLRSYAGVFDGFVKIDESKIARRIEKTENQVIAGLKFLAAKNIIAYIPKNDKPRLTFVEERLPLKNLIFDKEKMDFLFNVRSKNIASVFKFIENDEVCKSIQILNYFGEKKEVDCGLCNVCRSKAIVKPVFKNLTNAKDAIKEVLLRNKKLSADKIIAKVSTHKTDTVIETLEAMLSNNEIKRDGDLMFSLR